MTAATRAIGTASAPLHGSIRVPGSKSVSNRALLLAAIARGTSRLHGVLRSDDTNALAASLETMGAAVRWDGDVVEIDGVAGRFPGGGMLDVGHGGTPARFLMAAACLADAPVRIDGSARLRQRPMAEGINVLCSLGASIESTDVHGHLPVQVEPCMLRGGEVTLGSTASSQFISALMLVAATLPEGLLIEFSDPVTSSSYVLLTAHELECWGVGVEVEVIGDELSSVRIRPGMIAAQDRVIPPDASSIVYWAVAGSIVPGSDITLVDVQQDDPQPDLGVLAAMAEGGAHIEWSMSGVRVQAGDTFEGWRTLDGSLMPDGALALAVAAACGSRISTITGLETLRVKETDRVKALETELVRLGAEVHADASSVRVHPLPQHLLTGDAPPIVVETYDDHRMAMAFAILGLRRGGVVIKDPSCVSKSYPGFWDDFNMVVHSNADGEQASP
ncbi:MAG: 3-phosphoshikimate 1-carboxyvinyltransferase [Phycisphaerales bacterium]|nr:3-phosphoshikimate 1-carboxyvinyltransferase [Phycisphaerales bacterium]